jgi:hypothetical protein
MHYDNLDNVFAQVVGSKTFVLAPPDAGSPFVRRRLRKAVQEYTHPGCFSRDCGRILEETVINYLNYPGVTPPPSMPTVSVTLAPGDMLYLPVIALPTTHYPRRTTHYSLRLPTTH